MDRGGAEGRAQQRSGGGVQPILAYMRELLKHLLVDVSRKGDTRSVRYIRINSSLIA